MSSTRETARCYVSLPSYVKAWELSPGCDLGRLLVHLFVSYLSGITLFYCLLSKVYKTHYFLCFSNFIVVGRRVNPVPVFPYGQKQKSISLLMTSLKSEFDLESVISSRKLE